MISMQASFCSINFLSVSLRRYKLWALNSYLTFYVLTHKFGKIRTQFIINKSSQVFFSWSWQAKEEIHAGRMCAGIWANSRHYCGSQLCGAGGKQQYGGQLMALGLHWWQYQLSGRRHFDLFAKVVAWKISQFGCCYDPHGMSCDK